MSSPIQCQRSVDTGRPHARRLTSGRQSAGREVRRTAMIHPSRVEAFGAWYAQVSAAAETPIAELVESFEAGVTPEEMNAR